MKRRGSLKALGIIGLQAMLPPFGVAQGASSFGASPPFDTSVIVDLANGTPANARLCGSNVQWVDGGDGLLSTSGTAFALGIVDKVKQLSPTVIRYPGGSQSDVFHWQAGVGEEAARATCEHFHRKDKQIVRFGTGEFLALCAATGAEALITANVATGTPEEAAAWVRLTNVTRLRRPGSSETLPCVKFWELGNEPYLKEDMRPETWMAPEDYARKADAFMRAMRKVDPSIQIGLPLRSDTFNGIPVTPHQGFNQRVLATLRERFDFVSLHDAYLPFLYDKVPGDDEIYAALMGASRTVELDLEATRNQLKKIWGRTLPLAITEYNALVTLGRRQDGYLSSPAGALYVADLLRLFAQQSDVLMANHWSLIGNWEFGALTTRGSARPVFEVLRGFRSVLRGQMARLVIQSKVFSTPRVGLIQEASGLSVVTGIATLEADRLRLVLINKDPKAESQTMIALRSGHISAVRDIQSLVASKPFASANDLASLARRTVKGELSSDGCALLLPPASMTTFEFAVG